MADPFATSPLAGSAAAFSEMQGSSGGALRIRELPFTAQITLRLDACGPAVDGVARVLGGPLPLEPNTCARYGAIDVLWMGPDEWLLVSSELAPSELERLLGEEFGAQHATAVDVSEQRTIVELGGSAARTVLARGCALDLHESRFAAGQCAQTLVAQVQVILQPLPEDDTVRVFVRASFAYYFAEWLLDASVEEHHSGGDGVRIGAGADADVGADAGAGAGGSVGLDEEAIAATP